MAEPAKNCSRCFEALACTGTETCWCSNYEMPEALRVEIRQFWHDCLCAGCLVALGARPLSNPKR